MIVLPGSRKVRHEMAIRFARVLEADLATPSLLRRALLAWLGELCWPADETEDLVLAVDEAVANVVDHAYLHADAGQDRVVGVYAVAVPSPERRRIRVQVVDSGRWRPTRSDPGYRGRGLSMMRACCDSLHIHPTPTGTRVTITSRPMSTPQRISAYRSRVTSRSGMPAGESAPRWSPHSS
jgi:serine/threonine-protein kinase RsbW